jgi:hypothetical protein
MGFRGVCRQIVVQKQQPQQPDEAFFEAAADYMMLDNQDIYACLSEY